jgi:hypothetical protein
LTHHFFLAFQDNVVLLVLVVQQAQLVLLV